MTSKTLFGTNGIRGIVNTDLTPNLIVRLGVALGTYFGSRNIIVGYDARTSNDIFAKAITAGLASAGTNVFEVGLAPTPAIQFAVKHFGKDGAVIITASHNPPEYNGVKVVTDDGIEISRTEEMKIEELFYNERFCYKEWDKLGTISSLSDILRPYMDAIKSHVDMSAIGRRHFKIVVDSANSVGGLVTPRLLSDLGCEVTTLNAHIDGRFPGRLPEPKPETLEKLSRTVTALGADLGIAHDGDADRCLFVDEKGNVCLGDKTGAIIIDYVLEERPPSIVVTPVSSSRMVEDVVQSRHSTIRWTKVGSTHVSREMVEHNSIVSMEDNGGIFYAPHQPVRDGAMAAALMLEILAKRERPLSELVALLPTYHIVKERISCPNECKEKILDELLEMTKSYDRTTIDGVKVLFDDGSVLIRPSGTEAIYRVYAEAKNEKRAIELADWGKSMVKQCTL